MKVYFPAESILFVYGDEEATGGRSGRFRYLTKYEK